MGNHKRGRTRSKKKKRMALVLRIKFPPTYPLIYKTLRIDENFPTRQAISYIAETLNLVNLNTSTIGIYLPKEKYWLEDDRVLTEYPALQDCDEIEYRDRNAGAGPAPDGSCCTIL